MTMKYIPFLRRSCWTLSLLLVAGILPLCAQGISFVQHFDKSLYGRGTQTWQVAPLDGHFAYFANQNGVLQFDGGQWTVLPLDNRSDVRSLCIDRGRGRIYAGGINEFGYFEPDHRGVLQYHCLSDSLDGSVRFLGNVWGIHEQDRVLYFQGDDRVVKLVDGDYSVIPYHDKIDCSSMVNGVLYIGTERGPGMLVGNSFFPLHGAGALNGKRVRDILPYRDRVLLVTAYDGLWLYDGHQLERLLTGQEQLLRDSEVFCVALRGNQVALGTIHRGVILIDLATGGVRHFNEENGLHNNTVLSLAFDDLGNLWAGMDSGIDYIYLNAPFRLLYAAPYNVGAGYTAALGDGVLYLGTNRGLYHTPYPLPADGSRPDLHPVPLSSGQVWNLTHVDGELICLHDRGLFRVEGTRLVRIGTLTGVWSCQPVEGHPGCLWVGTYNGLYLMRRTAAGEWQLVGKVEGLNDSCRLFVQEDDGVVWNYKNNLCSRFVLSEDLLHLTSEREYGVGQGLPADSHCYPLKVRGKVCFATREGLYTYRAAADSIVPCDTLNQALGGKMPYLRVEEWCCRLVSLSPNELCLSTPADTGVVRCVFPFKGQQMELVGQFEQLIPLNDSLLAVPCEEGFALCNLAARSTAFKGAVHIRSMHLTKPGDSLIFSANFCGEKPLGKVRYSQNSVRFDYGVTLDGQDGDVRYRVRLNRGPWSDYTPLTTKEYSSLFEGHYLFEVCAHFADGSTATDALAFDVLPPWYRSWPMLVVDVLLLLLGALALTRWDKRRMRLKKQQAVVEKEREIQRMEQAYEEEKARREQQIVRLEKEKLEHDLRHKSQEMANLMINFVRKNEMLSELKSQILKVASQLKAENAKESKRQLMAINGMIDANIQSDEVLKRIEEQFDLVHNNFMKHLHERHPDLNDNERMMCAYLKMNLSTKEIAPLLNISVRGVETIRYRLRKKFGLEREESLTEYLARV